MQRAARTPFTFSANDMWLSEFRLRPSDPAWERSSVTTSDAILIAIPRTTVGIRHEGRPEITADPTCAVFYGPGQRYRRRLVTSIGDDCTVIAIGDSLAEQARLPRLRSGMLPFVSVALDLAEYESAHRARYSALRSTAGADRVDAVREEVYWLVGRLSDRARAHADRADSECRTMEVVEAARLSISRDLSANRPLDELAADIHVSPFHLARTFRRLTGRPIHRYRTELRLRASLARISDGQRLSDVAADLGFASHAHLTDRFRREFGVSPYKWRAALALKNSKIMEA